MIARAHDGDGVGTPQDHGGPRRLTITPWSVTRVLLAIIAGLTLADVAGQLAKYGWGIERAGGLIPGFDMDREANFPTWYSQALLLFSAFLLALIASAVKRMGGRDVLHWRVLAFLFLGFSIDELAGVHELLIPALRPWFGGWAVLYHTWVVPGGLFTLVVGLSFLRFLGRLPHQTRTSLVVAGFVYVTGALVMEMVSGAYRSRYGEAHLTYAMLTTVEEALEMLGVTMFIHALLAYLQGLAVTLSVGGSTRSGGRVRRDTPEQRPSIAPYDGATASPRMSVPTGASPFPLKTSLERKA